MRIRVLVLLPVLALAASFAAPASASQLVNRGVTNIKLAVDSKGEALVSYRTVRGQAQHVLAWGAVNARQPNPALKQLEPLIGEWRVEVPQFPGQHGRATFDWLEDGEGISNDELDRCAKQQKVEIGRGDFVIIRTGQMERCLEEKKWGGYAGGDAPGVRFENCYWCQDKEIAAICTDTWGVEVRPNETTEANQPWHWVVIPAMGLCMGEIFYLKDLAQDCAEDGVYEFFFCGPPLIITGGTGSPINPQAIK